MDRDSKRLRDRVERRLRDFDLEVDIQLLAALLARAAALPEAEARIAALEPLLAGASGDRGSREAFARPRAELLAASKPRREGGDPRAARGRRADPRASK
jgi:hypothetical protein